MRSYNGILGTGMASLGLASLAAAADQLKDMPSMVGVGQPHRLGKGIRTGTSKYMPHHGKNVRYMTTDHGILRIKL